MTARVLFAYAYSCQSAQAESSVHQAAKPAVPESSYYTGLTLWSLRSVSRQVPREKGPPPACPPSYSVPGDARSRPPRSPTRAAIATPESRHVRWLASDPQHAPLGSVRSPRGHKSSRSIRPAGGSKSASGLQDLVPLAAAVRCEGSCACMLTPPRGLLAAQAAAHCATCSSTGQNSSLASRADIVRACEEPQTSQCEDDASALAT